MELELRRLEDLAESIVNDFAYMRAREEEMRDTNGVLLFSVQNMHLFYSFPLSPTQNQPTLGCSTSVCCLWCVF